MSDEISEREQGQEDVLAFIRNGRFLHEEAPTAQFAREIEANWRSHGKAAVTAASEKKVNQFRTAIATAINFHSMENGSDTPDFILAEYLSDCLVIFDKTVRARERWYSRDKKPIPVGLVDRNIPVGLVDRNKLPENDDHE